MTNKNPAEASSKEVVSVDAMLKKELAELNTRVGAPPSNKISTKGKKFTLPDGQANTTLSVIVLDWRYVLAHYPGAYNANNPQDPNCFAVGIQRPEDGKLLPHESIKNPQHDNCGGCPKNQWKSAPTGNGKACKNQIRLMIIGKKFDENSQPLTLYISPTGLKNWNAYVTDLNNSDGLHFMQVVTDISFDPNETYPKLQFSRGEPNTAVAESFALRNRHQSVVERPIELRGDRS